MKKIFLGLMALSIIFSTASCMKSEEEKRVESEADTIFQNAENYFNDGNYENAISEYKQVAEDTPNYDKAQERIKEANEKYKQEILSDAQKSANEKLFTSAIETIQSALDKFPDDSELLTKIEEYKKEYSEYTKEQANTLILEDNYEEAINTLNIDDIDNYPDIKTLYNDCIQKYVDKEIKNADSLIKKNKYDEAISELEKVLNIVGDNSKIQDKLDKIKDSKPVPLSEIKMSNEQGLTLEENAMEDVIGKTYTGTNIFSLNHHGSYNNYGEFYLGGEYTKMSGIITPFSKFGEDSAVNIEIYGDDKIKYTLKVNQKTLATSFEVNLKGVQWLKIKASEIDGYKRWDADTIIADACLYK